MNKLKILSMILMILVSLSIVLATMILSKSAEKSTPASQNTSGDTTITKDEVTEPEIDYSTYINYMEESGVFELPINGATGFVSNSLNLRTQPNLETSEVIRVLSAGQPFLVLEEVGEWWKIQIEEEIGYVAHKYCFVNLPDIIPSIVYNNTNTYSSVYVTSGFDIPNITGEKLYDAKSFNERLGKEEYIMPVHYSMASKISKAQQSALKDGNTLVIYEAFRPYEAQMNIVNNVMALMKVNDTVRQNISGSVWSTSWFIATGVANHQEGYAMDVTLGKYNETEQVITGDYVFTQITDHEEYEMPTHIHELSCWSVSLSQPVAILDKYAWINVEPAETMNEHSLLLREYCTDAGLTPLASEWWHFNDLDSPPSGNGDYFTEFIYSISP